MILTVTMNPSIDTRYQLDTLVIDDVNRVTPAKTAGGKGLNVSRVLRQLGDDVLATGLLGGHMGAYMRELMEADGIPNDFTPIAGSLPKGVPADCYAGLVAAAVAADVPVLLDTSGASLDAALEAETKPTLVKPNLTEINGLLGTSYTPDQVSELAAALEADTRFAGIPWVVVSMGAAGSFAFHGGKIYRAVTPPIPAVNATGSGDSTIAGFAHAIAAGEDDITVLKTANTCGKLNAIDPQTGHLAMDRWDEVYAAVEVTEL